MTKRVHRAGVCHNATAGRHDLGSRKLGCHHASVVSLEKGLSGPVQSQASP